MNIDGIMEEAERLAIRLRSADVEKPGSLRGEAEKAGHYFGRHGGSPAAMERYLTTLAKDPPERSNQTKLYYAEILRIWRDWKPSLPDQDKVRAWGWAVRLARCPGLADTERSRAGSTAPGGRYEPPDSKLPAAKEPKWAGGKRQERRPEPPRREKVTLLEDPKAGKARARTSSGEECVCEGLPVTARKDQTCQADVTRQDGVAIKMVFKSLR